VYRRVARLGFAQIHRVLDSPNYYGVFLHYNGVDSLQRRRGMLALRFMSSFLGKKILTAKPVQFEGVMPVSRGWLFVLQSWGRFSNIKGE
jgi:hypothetical protein